MSDNVEMNVEQNAESNKFEASSEGNSESLTHLDPQIFQLSIELAADGAFLIRPDSSVVYANTSACEKLGYQREELVGMKVCEWDSLFTQEVWLHFWEALKQKKQRNYEAEHRHKIGHTFPVRIKAHYLKLENSELMVAFVSDISEEKAKIQEISKKSERLEALIDTKTRELNREKEKFERFVNLAPVGIAINRVEDGGFEYINSEFSHFTGYDIDELNKMDYWQLTPEEYQEQEQVQLQSMAETGRYGPYQKEYIHKEGHRYPVLLSGIKIRDYDQKEYIWSVVQDISDQFKAQELLHQAKAQADMSVLRMKLANDSAGIGVWEWDLVENTLTWDKWMYKLYGVSIDEFSGAYEAWSSRVHPDDIEEARLQLDNAINGLGRYDLEFRVILSDGAVRNLKASAEVLRDENGNAKKMVGVNYDITERIEALEHVNNAKKAAENASRSKSNFLANMSHEIRTPMNAVIGMTNQLLKTDLSEPQLNGVMVIKKSANALMAIINDILDLSKIESGKLAIECIPFNIEKLVHDVASTAYGLVDSKKITFVLNFTTSQVDDSHCHLGDPTRIRQILLNLVSNAIKFTEQGEISLNVDRIDANSERDRVRFEVVDSGIGIDSQTKTKLFKRFSQADESTTRKFGGTGLGLTICKQLVELMQGEINFSSELGKGSSFWFDIPLQRTTCSTASQVEELPENWEDFQFPGASVLLVEDNEINRELAIMNLEDSGVDIDWAENGEVALNKVKEKHFDIIFMDCQMPVMDGYDATKRIRALGHAKSLPIIALTANAMQGEDKNVLRRV